MWLILKQRIFNMINEFYPRRILYNKERTHFYDSMIYEFFFGIYFYDSSN